MHCSTANFLGVRLNGLQDVEHASEQGASEFTGRRDTSEWVDNLDIRQKVWMQILAQSPRIDIGRLGVWA